MESNLSLTTHNIDLTFKKGNYTNTYMHIKPMGTPNGAIAYLLDENDNQLYSPVDANGIPGKTPCFVTIGSTNVIPLPANYNGDYYTDFNAGTYNWKLKYEGNAIYKSYTLPLTVKIIDFKVWTPISSIYPDEQLYVNVKNYDNTIPTFTEIDNLFDYIFDIHGSENITYEDIDGILGFHDMNVDVGQHTYCPDNLPSHNIKYEVKNPISFLAEISSNYSTSLKLIGYHIERETLFLTINQTIDSIIVNNNSISYTMEGSDANSVLWSISGDKFPPGTYHCVVTSPILKNNKQYTCEGDFEVYTTNCTIVLETNSIFNSQATLTATYKYSSTPIPYAKIEIHKDNILIDTLITDNNGQISLNAQGVGNYIAKVIDIGTDNVLLTSNTVEIINAIEESHYTYDLEDLSQQDVIAKVTSNLGEVISVSDIAIKAPNGTSVLVQNYNSYHITQQDITVYYDPDIITFNQGTFPINIIFNYSHYGESRTAYCNCLLTIE